MKRKIIRNLLLFHLFYFKKLWACCVIFSCAVMTGETLGAYLLATKGLSVSIPDIIVYRYAISILSMAEVMTIAVMIFYRIMMDND